MKIARPLIWAPPSNDDLGHEDMALIARGLCGHYAIDSRPNPDGTVNLWWAHNAFTFEECRDVEAAKALAEADWQERMLAATVFDAPLLTQVIEAMQYAGGTGLALAVSGPQHPKFDDLTNEIFRKCNDAVRALGAALRRAEGKETTDAG